VPITSPLLQYALKLEKRKDRKTVRGEYKARKLRAGSQKQQAANTTQ
jgi:hypothetical protein